MNIPFISKYFSGSYIGGFLDTYGRAATVISGIQFVAVLIIFYTTSAKIYILQYAPWFTFTHYLVLVFIGMVFLMLFARILVIPSAYTFYNQQIWDNNNPMREKIEQIEKNQKRIMEKLGIEDK